MIKKNYSQRHSDCFENNTKYPLNKTWERIKHITLNYILCGYTFFIICIGERYDVVVEADQPVGAYYIFVEGLGNCDPFSQVAVLRYEGAPSRPSVPLRVAFPDTAAGYVS